MPIFLTRLLAQIIKEFLCLLRDPKSRIVLIVPPLVQLVVFSFAATLDVENVAIAVWNQDSGKAADTFIANLKASPFVAHLYPVDNDAAFVRLMDEQKVIAGIRIPSDFSQKMANQQNAALLAVFDGRRANAAQITASYLNEIAKTASLEI